MADATEKQGTGDEGGAQAPRRNPLKSAASSARGRWVDFLDTSYDGSVVWALRRGFQWVGVFFRSIKELGNSGRGGSE